MEGLLEKLPEATLRPNNFGFTREIILLYSAICAVLLVLFGLFTSYDESEILSIGNAAASASAAVTNGTTTNKPIISIPDSARFSYFQDVHLVVFIGFGFLYSYLCHGALTATGHSLIVGTFATFFALLCRGFFASSTAAGITPTILNIRSLIEADFAAAACLISFGAVLGRVTIPQLLAMAFLEVFFYTFNEGRMNGMGVADVGGSVQIFSFGAYFGLAASLVCLAGGRDEHKSNRYNKSSDFTNALSMLGTLFMFVYFPSFNAAAANSQASMTRSVVNTYLSLTTSVIATIFIEMYLHCKIHPWKVQRATLAGGIVIGSVANMTFTPFRACLAGVIGAFVVHFGAEYVTPYLRKNLGLSEDTIGVNHVFGLTGIAGGILGIFASCYASKENYGNSNLELNSVFSRMGFATTGSSENPRVRSAQVIAQLAGIIVTVIIALVGGILTGIVMRYIPDPDALYHDAESYRVEDIPDTTPSPEQEIALAKRKKKEARKKLLAEARAACREAFEKRDAAASKKAHQLELELERAGIRKKLFKKKEQQGEAEEKQQESEQQQENEQQQKETTSSKSSYSGEGSGSDSDSDDDDFLVHTEPHSEIGGDTSKTIVFGALDGIMTTFAVVTAAAGGNQDWKIIVSYGFAHLLADAFSMGFGDYIGSKAELDKARAEREREVWETENNPEGEIKEMTDIYVCRGFDREDALALVKIHAKDKERFVDFMMKEELEIDVDIDDEWGPIEGSLVMFFSFLAFGSVSLIPYLGQTGKGVDGVFGMSCALVGLGLLGLGALKGSLTGLPIARTAVSMLVSGLLSGGISYFIGVFVAEQLISSMGGDTDSASWA